MHGHHAGLSDLQIVAQNSLPWQVTAGLLRWGGSSYRRKPPQAKWRSSCQRPSGTMPRPVCAAATTATTAARLPPAALRPWSRCSATCATTSGRIASAYVDDRRSMGNGGSIHDAQHRETGQSRSLDMSQNPQRMPLMRSSDSISATGRSTQHKQPQKNHAPILGQSLGKSAASAEGAGVFWVFLHLR